MTNNWTCKEIKPSDGRQEGKTTPKPPRRRGRFLYLGKLSDPPRGARQGRKRPAEGGLCLNFGHNFKDLGSGTARRRENIETYDCRVILSAGAEGNRPAGGVGDGVGFRFEENRGPSVILTARGPGSRRSEPRTGIRGPEGARPAGKLAELGPWWAFLQGDGHGAGGGRDNAPGARNRGDSGPLGTASRGPRLPGTGNGAIMTAMRIPAPAGKPGCLGFRLEENPPASMVPPDPSRKERNSSRRAISGLQGKRLLSPSYGYPPRGPSRNRPKGPVTAIIRGAGIGILHKINGLRPSWVG